MQMTISNRNKHTEVKLPNIRDWMKWKKYKLERLIKMIKLNMFIEPGLEFSTLN